MIESTVFPKDTSSRQDAVPQSTGELNIPTNGPSFASAPLAAASYILATRLQRPRTSGDLVQRSHLLEQLNTGLRLRRKLTLVSAPAGYGKTTLVAQWLHQQRQPSAWLSLEETDDDLNRFLAYLFAAIQTRFPQACQQAALLRHAHSQPAPQVIADILINDLANVAQDFILVLDDYHTVQALSIQDFIIRLIRYLPAQMHLVLITRTDPSLPLASLRAAGELQELRGRDLCFSSKECRAFLQQTVRRPVAEEVIGIIAERTEGWAAGLRLASLSLQTTADVASLLDGLAQNQLIVDYLAHEVLASLSRKRIEFLLKTAILEQMTAPLCVALLEPARSDNDAEATQLVREDNRSYTAWVQRELESFERSNLFTIALDLKREWYRYHHLFRELLQRALHEQYHPAEIASLHARASQWYARHGFVEEAARHSVLAGDPVSAALVIEAHILDIFNQQESQLVERWLKLLPPPVVEQRPLLLVMRAWLEHDRGRRAVVRQLLGQIEQLLAQGTHGLDPLTEQTVRGKVVALWTVEAAIDEAYQRTIELADEALRLLPSKWQRPRGGVINHKVLALDALSRRAEAMHVLAEELGVEGDETGEVQVSLLITWGFLAMKSGDPAKMIELGAQGLRFATQTGQIQATIFCRFRMGIAHFKRNELVEAREHFHYCLEMRYVAYILVLQESLAGLALIDPQQAETYLADLLALNLAVGGEQAVLLSNSLAARIALLQGDQQKVHSWLRTAQPLPTAWLQYMIELPQLTHVRALIATGERDMLERALDELQWLRTQAETQHYTYHLVDILAVEAVALDAGGHSTEALASLAQAVELAEPGRMIRIFVELGAAIGALLQRLAGMGNRPVQWLLTNLNLTVATPVPAQPAALPIDSSLFVEPLTNRELDVLHLLALRLADKEIAAQLHISVATVQQHNKNIYQKLQVNKRREAVARARSLGLLPRSSEQ